MIARAARGLALAGVMLSIAACQPMPSSSPPTSSPATLASQPAISADDAARLARASLLGGSSATVVSVKLSTFGIEAPSSGMAASDTRVWAVRLTGSFQPVSCGPAPEPSQTPTSCPPPQSTALILVDAITGAFVMGEVPDPHAPEPMGPAETIGASMGRWRIDVVNGPRPIIIRLYPPIDTLPNPTWTDGSYLPFAWQVEANARLTLVDQAIAPQAGSFDLLQALNDPSKLDHCHVFQTLEFSAESFTIRLSGDATGPTYSARIEPGLPPLEPLAPYPDVSVANCSG